jgi:hypothetical protein
VYCSDGGGLTFVISSACYALRSLEPTKGGLCGKWGGGVGGEGE